jgi:hypothetical protein
MNGQEPKIEKELGGSSPARKPWLTPLVGVGLWLTSVMALTGLLSGVLWSLRASGTPSQTDLDRWQWGSREKKLSALREAFSHRRPEVTDPRRDEIEKFLTEATRGNHSIDEAIGVLDEARFRQRVQDSPWGRSLSWLDGRQLKGMSLSEFSVVSPKQVTSLKLMQIAPWASGDEVLVFTLLRQGYNDVEPVLFWLSHTGGRWKVVNWEFVDSGWSEAESAAHWIAMRSDPRGTNYELAMWELRGADRMEYSKRDDYEKSLREVDAYDIPSAARDYTRYLLMNRWSHQGRPEEVLRLAALIQNPDRVPGIHWLKATAFQRLGRIEEAFANLDHLEKLVGFRPSIAASRAHLLQQEKRRNDALAQWRLLADFDPEEQSYLSQLLRLLPKGQRSEVLDRIKTHREPLKRAAEVATYNQYQLDDQLLNEFSKFAQSIAPESPEARRIEILRLERSDQFQAAAALTRKAAEQETDEAKRLQHWHEYLTQMHQAGELASGFANNPDPQAAFQHLVSGMEDSESVVAVEDLPILLAAYRPKQSNDPWLPYYEGYYAVEKDLFAEANDRFAAAERLLPAQKPGFSDDDEDDENLSGLRNLLRMHRCRVRYELGQGVAALEEYGRDKAAYQTLAQLAVQYRHWHELDRLNQSFAIQHAQDPWLNYYEAKCMLVAKNLVGARGKLRRLKLREELTEGLEYYRDELEVDLLLAELSDPIAVYQQAPNHETVFNRFSRKMLAEHDWDNLEKLCQKNRVGPNSPEVKLIRLEQAWEQRDDAALVKLLTPWPTETFASRKYFETTWRERLVRSLLRLNRWDEALRLAQENYQRHEEAWPLVMTYVAQKNAAEIIKLLREDEAFAKAWKHRDFAADPNLGAVLLDEAFAEIRQQEEFTLPNALDGESLTLLLRQPAELTERWLRERLAEPDAALEMHRLSNTTWIVTWKGSRFQLVMSPTPLFSAEFVNRHVPFNSRQRPSGDPFGVLLEQHAHLAITPLRDDTIDSWYIPLIMARQLGSRLLSDNVVGALFRQPYSPLRFLCALSENSAEALASRRSLQDLDPRGIYVRITPQSHRLTPDQQQALRKRIITSRSETNPQTVLLQVLMADGPLPISETFRVTDIRRQPYGGYELIVEYAGSNPNLLFPELHPGIKYAVPIEQVVNFHNAS